MPLYAAYGTNMDSTQMLRHAPHSPLAGTGWLEGWRLTFGGADLSWDGSLATVVEDPDSRVFVVLYDVPESDEKSLDEWEGGTMSAHRKIRCRINARLTPPARGLSDNSAHDSGTEPLDLRALAGLLHDSGQEESVLVWFYVLDDYEGGLPSAHYLGMLANAAEEAGAPRDYVRQLRMRSCTSNGPGLELPE